MQHDMETTVTPERVEAAMREAHRIRSEVVRSMIRGLFAFLQDPSEPGRCSAPTGGRAARTC